MLRLFAHMPEADPIGFHFASARHIVNSRRESPGDVVTTDYTRRITGRHAPRAITRSWLRSRSAPRIRIGAGSILALPVILVFALTLTLARCATALAEVATPLGSVKGAIDKTVEILHDDQTPLEQRRRELRELAQRNLDLSRMARVALGPHWEQLSEAQRTEFVSLFAAFIETAYLDQIQDYAKLRIDVSTQSFHDRDHAQVSATVFQPGEAPMPITFMLENRDQRWLVYDVDVASISMVANYRAQFDRVIRDQGIGELMDRLRRKQAQLAGLLGQPTVDNNH